MAEVTFIVMCISFWDAPQERGVPDHSAGSKECENSHRMRKKVNPAALILYAGQADLSKV